MVHAGAAADAAQHLAQAFRQHPRAAVVDQDDVHLLRTVRVARPLRPAVERRVLGQLATRGGAHQQPQQRHRMRGRRHQLLDPGGDDVHPGRGRGQLGIALVGDGADRTGVGDQEVGAGDPDVGGEELLAQLAPGALAPWPARPRSSCGWRWAALNRTETCSRVRCIAGQMMCEGGSPASWMMCSARSVSTRSIPASARACGSPISSPSIDLARVTRLASAARQISMTIRQASSAVAAQCTLAPEASALRSNSSR